MTKGAGWEAQLDHWHARYRAAGLADVQRVHPGVRVLGRIDPNGQFRACWAGEGPVDYLGVLPGGRPVAFDAKSTTSATWSRSVIPAHQVRLLDLWDSLGAVTGIALRLPTSRWWMPWPELRGRDKAIQHVGDLERWARPIGPDGWLSCL